MYFAYIDESGKANFKDKGKIYVLSSLIFNEVDWHIIDKRIKKLKREIVPLLINKPTDPDELELHFKEINSTRNYYYGLNESTRHEIMTRISYLISSLNVRIISVVLLKENQ